MIFIGLISGLGDLFSLLHLASKADQRFVVLCGSPANNISLVETLVPKNVRILSFRHKGFFPAAYVVWLFSLIWAKVNRKSPTVVVSPHCAEGKTNRFVANLMILTSVFLNCQRRFDCRDVGFWVGKVGGIRNSRFVERDRALIARYLSILPNVCEEDDITSQGVATHLGNASDVLVHLSGSKIEKFPDADWLLQFHKLFGPRARYICSMYDFDFLSTRYSFLDLEIVNLTEIVLLYQIYDVVIGLESFSGHLAAYLERPFVCITVSTDARAFLMPRSSLLIVQAKLGSEIASVYENFFR